MPLLPPSQLFGTVGAGRRQGKCAGPRREPREERGEAEQRDEGGPAAAAAAPAAAAAAAAVAAAVPVPPLFLPGRSLLCGRASGMDLSLRLSC